MTEDAKTAQRSDPAAVAERAVTMIRRLADENANLRRRIGQWEKIDVEPLIPREGGGEVWWALMEDMRDDGLVKLETTRETWLGLHFVPVASAEQRASESPS